MKLYVGNLSYEITEQDLQQMFEQFGQVGSANIIKDKYSGQSKGFGFVEMDAQAEAQAAIEALNGKEMKGRAIIVNEARPRTESSGGGRGGPGGGGGRGPGGGGRGGQGGGRGGQGGFRGGPGSDRGGQGGSGRGGQGGGRGY
jgi:RNA recognition motif-containing protein